MARKDVEIVYLVSTAGTNHYYTTTKSKKGEKRGTKLQMRKYDPIARKHVLYKEGKLKKQK